MSFCIAVDGPAGAGKSTIAKMVAKKMNLIYVDTGAMYRAMAYYLLSQGVDLGNQEEISDKCQNADISIIYENNEQVVILNGQNVNPYLRTEEVGKAASVSSANARVRERLVELQQRMAEHTDLIMDGRDIGTCILPKAQLKIYLTASSRVRALRRYKELLAKGEACDMDVIEADIIDRDYRDMHRDISPLKQADDAVLVDTSEMTIEEVVDTIVSLAEGKRN
ncbi:MAG: (d)CMP kinase [Lachnospiraceae bacterium]|nr:(d)CMP kinase [Lachnospiraceae bacterium]